MNGCILYTGFHRCRLRLDMYATSRFGHVGGSWVADQLMRLRDFITLAAHRQWAK